MKTQINNSDKSLKCHVCESTIESKEDCLVIFPNDSNTFGMIVVCKNCVGAWYIELGLGPKPTDSPRAVSGHLGNIFDAAYTKIQACNPCSYADLLRECKTQVVDFDVDDWHDRLLLDKAVTELVKKGLVIIETVFDENEPFHKIQIVFNLP